MTPDNIISTQTLFGYCVLLLSFITVPRLTGHSELTCFYVTSGLLNDSAIPSSLFKKRPRTDTCNLSPVSHFESMAWHFGVQCFSFFLCLTCPAYRDPRESKAQNPFSGSLYLSNLGFFSENSSVLGRSENSRGIVRLAQKFSIPLILFCYEIFQILTSIFKSIFWEDLSSEFPIQSRSSRKPEFCFLFFFLEF